MWLTNKLISIENLIIADFQRVYLFVFISVAMRIETHKKAPQSQTPYEMWTVHTHTHGVQMEFVWYYVVGTLLLGDTKTNNIQWLHEWSFSPYNIFCTNWWRNFGVARGHDEISTNKSNREQKHEREKDCDIDRPTDRSQNDKVIEPHAMQNDDNNNIRLIEIHFEIFAHWMTTCSYIFDLLANYIKETENERRRKEKKRKNKTRLNDCVACIRILTWLYVNIDRELIQLENIQHAIYCKMFAKFDAHIFGANAIITFHRQYPYITFCNRRRLMTWHLCTGMRDMSHITCVGSIKCITIIYIHTLRPYTIIASRIL